MKINKWEELDDLKNGKYRVGKYCGFIAVQTITKCRDVVEIYFDTTPKDKILAILKLFGFDIEFEEAPKLSKREWHLVNYLPEDWWIARNMILYAFQSKPIETSVGYFCGKPNDEHIKLTNGLFPFIGYDRAWSVKELRELEVSSED
ncbi:MAG: hypothetical protein M0R38_12220 [Bacteroidia bacterium]|nr:hypothetical protein [Bacteroidia bacterium]